MKTDALYKRAFNDALLLLSQLPGGAQLPSETVLAQRLKVSRTTVRKIVAVLTEQGTIHGSGRTRFMRQASQQAAPFPESETVPAFAQVERLFMEWLLHGDAKPGAAINELDLARQFGVATTVIREFLNSFQRFGLIERRPSGGWVLQGFNAAFALELFEIREMFELRSARAFAELDESSPLWGELRALRADHVALLGEIDSRFHDFSALDSRFHRLVNAARANRFIDDFFDIITMIFHYHYQWNKKDERQRNEVAINEHLAYIDALLSRSRTATVAACRAHLTSARQTLIRSTSNDPDPDPTRRRKLSELR